MKRYLVYLTFFLLAISSSFAQKTACATNVMQIVNGQGVANQKTIKNSGLSLLKKTSGQYIYGNNVEVVGNVIKALNNQACYLNIANTKTLSAVIYFKSKADAIAFWNELMTQCYTPCKGSDNLYEKVHNNVVYHVVQKAVYKNGWYTINLNVKRPTLNSAQTDNRASKTVATATPPKTVNMKTTQNKPNIANNKNNSTTTTSFPTKPITPKSSNTTSTIKTKEQKPTYLQQQQKTTPRPMRFTPETPRKD